MDEDLDHPSGQGGFGVSYSTLLLTKGGFMVQQWSSPCLQSTRFCFRQRTSTCNISWNLQVKSLNLGYTRYYLLVISKTSFYSLSLQSGLSKLLNLYKPISSVFVKIVKPKTGQIRRKRYQLRNKPFFLVQWHVTHETCSMTISFLVQVSNSTKPPIHTNCPLLLYLRLVKILTEWFSKVISIFHIYSY